MSVPKLHEIREIEQAIIFLSRNTEVMYSEQASRRCELNDLPVSASRPKVVQTWDPANSAHFPSQTASIDIPPYTVPTVTPIVQ